MDRIYEVSINPKPHPFGVYSIDLAPLPDWTGRIRKSTYANRAELSEALDRLGIVDNNKTSILSCVDRGDIYRILRFPVPHDTAITFGVGSGHEAPLNDHL